jgi:primosomal protein N' (replication factor Y)
MGDPLPPTPAARAIQEPGNRLVEVALVGAASGADLLTYAIPGGAEDMLAPGAAVDVPLGRRRVAGLVIGPHRGEPPPGVREILATRPEADLPAELFDLCTWASRYYRISLGRLLRSVLPATVRRRTRSQIVPTGERPPDRESREPLLLPDAAGKPARGGLTDRILARLPPTGLDLARLRRDFGAGTDAAVRRLRSAGLVRIEEVSITRREESRAVIAGESAPRPERAPRQAEIHEYVRSRNPHAVSRAELEMRFPGSGDAVRRLLAAGHLLGAEGAGGSGIARPDEPHRLNEEQQGALDAIAGSLGEFQALLLFGVTSSGKTEVYLRAAQEARAAGRGVLILVPEIGLTPQLIALAERRFPGEVAVLHSGLGEKARARTWFDIAAGRARIVIGARSAVFAPIVDPGLIIVDEEHDGAYKQEESPRYNGRDVAVMRAKQAGIPVVLASATPSLETWQAARSGRYRLLELRQRATPSPLPAVECIDLCDPAVRFRNPEPTRTTPGPPGPLSPPLEEALLETYRAGEQSLVFLNRRGFARFIQCEQCGRVEECPHCTVSLTLHRARSVAICHHCGYSRHPRPNCPDCDAALVGRSFGTEQVDGALRALLPAARIARLDRDTGASPDFVEQTLAAWRMGELDVLVGTQMIAKGHDAPGVTLIGVILADASLHFPDFRAGERTFQLLAQVAGRAGRGQRPGRVLIQTRQPEHPSLRAARAHDFRSFADGELKSRQELGYPPFGRLARVLFEGEPAAVEAAAARAAERLRGAAIRLAPTGAVDVLGPAPAPIERLRGRYRAHLLLKAPDNRAMARVLDALAGLPAPRDVRRVVDVDPQTMM